jgi:hypothetical protein
VSGGLLCVALLSGALSWELPLPGFELVWTHSVEHVEWRESYRVEPDALRLVAVKVKGSGAGMEPPDDAVLEAGWWVAHPMTPFPYLRLARSGAVPDYRLCFKDDCRALADWLPGLPPTGGLTMRSCI